VLDVGLEVAYDLVRSLLAAHFIREGDGGAKNDLAAGMQLADVDDLS
jgi:hypothetical protein